jgi:hypothetical protein
MSGEDEARLREQLRAYEHAVDANSALARVEQVETRGGEIHLWIEYRAANSIAERLRRGDLPMGRCWEVFTRLAAALDTLTKHGLQHGAPHPSWVDCSVFAPVLHGAVYALCHGAEDRGNLWSASWKGAVLQLESSPARQLLLQPVAIEAAVEVTKPSKPSV